VIVMARRAKLAIAIAIYAVAAAPSRAETGLAVPPLGSTDRPDFRANPPVPCAGERYRFGALRNCGHQYARIEVDGKWHYGPIYFRYHDGQRWFWWDGKWRRDEWRGGPKNWRELMQ
jgi:hypothetical protein